MKVKQFTVVEGVFQKEWLISFDYMQIYSEVVDAYGFVMTNTAAHQNNPIKYVVMSAHMLPYVMKRINRGGMYDNLDGMIRRFLNVSSITYLREVPDYCFYLVINE